MNSKQLDLWLFQNDINRYLKIEKYINKKFNYLNPKTDFTCDISYGVIQDIHITSEDNNKHKILQITINYKGQTYISKTSLTKENIEYLCGIAGIKKFNIKEIIGSKIKFSEEKMNF